MNPLSEYRQEEQKALAELRLRVGNLESQVSICDAVLSFQSLPACQQYLQAVKALREGYVFAAMQENSTAMIQRAAACDDMIAILTRTKERRQALAQELLEAKNQLESSVVVQADGEERLDPSGGMWR